MLGMTNNREPVKGKIARKFRSILKQIGFKKEKTVYVLLERWDFGDYPDSMVIGAYATFKDALARLDLMMKQTVLVSNMKLIQKGMEIVIKLLIMK